MGAEGKTALKRAFRAAAALALVVAAAPAGATPAGAEERWQALEPGLDLGRFTVPARNVPGDGIVTVVRADPARFKPVLVMAQFEDGRNRTVGDWAREKRLIVAVNAGLYQADEKTSVGLLRDGPRVNNPRFNAYRSVLGFTTRAGAAPARLFDRSCESDAAIRAYETLIQGLRLIDCRGQPAWRGRDRPFSMAVVGQDGRGRLLFIHTRTPHTPGDFAALLLGLPLDLRRAMYLEGGRPLGLHLSAGGVTLDLGGQCGSTGCSVLPYAPRPVPNVIGLVRR